MFVEKVSHQFAILTVHRYGARGGDQVSTGVAKGEVAGRGWWLAPLIIHQAFNWQQPAQLGNGCVTIRSMSATRSPLLSNRTSF